MLLLRVAAQRLRTERLDLALVQEPSEIAVRRQPFHCLLFAELVAGVSGDIPNGQIEAGREVVERLRDRFESTPHALGRLVVLVAGPPQLGLSRFGVAR